jgi:hypothetical protein
MSNRWHCHRVAPGTLPAGRAHALLSDNCLTICLRNRVCDKCSIYVLVWGNKKTCNFNVARSFVMHAVPTYRLHKHRRVLRGPSTARGTAVLCDIREYRTHKQAWRRTCQTTSRFILEQCEQWTWSETIGKVTVFWPQATLVHVDRTDTKPYQMRMKEYVFIKTADIFAFKMCVYFRACARGYAYSACTCVFYVGMTEC